MKHMDFKGYLKVIGSIFLLLLPMLLALAAAVVGIILVYRVSPTLLLGILLMEFSNNVTQSNYLKKHFRISKEGE